MTNSTNHHCIRNKIRRLPVPLSAVKYGNHFCLSSCTNIHLFIEPLLHPSETEVGTVPDSGKRTRSGLARFRGSPMEFQRHGCVLCERNPSVLAKQQSPQPGSARMKHAYSKSANSPSSTIRTTGSYTASPAVLKEKLPRIVSRPRIAASAAAIAFGSVDRASSTPFARMWTAA